MEARVHKLELSLKELQEEVRKMRASAPVAGHHAAATPPTVVAVQPEPKEDAEDLDAGGTQGDFKAVDSKVDDWEVYEFQRSIWDASMFVGLPAMGRLGSAVVCMLLMLTVAMQLVFCALINDHLTYALINEAKVEELRTWRISHAHNIRYMDTITLKSMARQVCNKENVIWSEGTKSLLSTIDEYTSYGGVDPSRVVLGPLLPTTQEVGPVMCVIALLVWYMTLLKDFEAARAVGRAMELVPRGPRTRLTEANAGGGTMAVECLSPARLCIALSTVLVRCLVHLVLLWSGSLYLVHTISLSDLILNAVALEVVLTLDSVVYEAFVPHDSKKLIGNLLPLPKPRKPSYKGVDVVSAASLTCAASLAIVMLFVFILPQVDLMKEARDAMCGGNVDFVAAFGNNGLLVVHPSPSEGLASSVASYEYQSISEAILAEEGLHPTDPARSLDLSVYALGIRGSQRSVEGMRDLGVAWATLLTNSFCQDYKNNSFATAGEEALLRSVFDFDSSVTADDFCSHPHVVSECPRDTPNGVRARQFCPVTCGCANPASSLILTHPDEGCPATCTVGIVYRVNLTVPKNCTNQDVTSEAWQAYGQGLQSLNASWAGEWQIYLTDTYKEVFGEGTVGSGCSVVGWWKFFLNVDLCDSENAWRWKPLTFLCPEACGCASEPAQIGCPVACEAN